MSVGSVLSGRSRAASPAERARGSRRRGRRIAGVLLGAMLALGAAAAPVAALSPPTDERDPADVAAITIAQTAAAEQTVSAPTARAEYHYDIGVACRALADPDCGTPEIRIPLGDGLAPVLAGSPEEHARFWSTAVAGAGPLADPAVTRDGDTLVITGTEPLLPGDSALVTLALGSSEARYVPGTREWALAPELWLGGQRAATADPVSSSYTSTLQTEFAPILSIPTGPTTRPGDHVDFELHAPCATAEFGGEQQLVAQRSTIQVTIPDGFELGAAVTTVPEGIGVLEGSVWTWTPAPEEHRCGDPATGVDDGVTMSFNVRQDVPLHVDLVFEATVRTTDWFGVTSEAESTISVRTGPATLPTDDALTPASGVPPQQPTASPSDPGTPPAQPTAVDPAAFSVRQSVTPEGVASLSWTPAGPAALTGAALYAGIPTAESATQIGQSSIGSLAAPLTDLGSVPAGFALEVSTAALPCAPELGERPGCVDDWAGPGAELSSVTALRLIATDAAAANTPAEFSYTLTPPSGEGLAQSTVAGAAAVGERVLPAAETNPELLLPVPVPEAPALTVDYRVVDPAGTGAGHPGDTEAAAWTTATGAETPVAVTVRNTGDVPLDDFTVVSERERGSAELSPLACAPRGPIAPGEAVECTGTIAPLGVEELHHSVAEATALSPAGTTVIASNPLWLRGPGVPVTPGPGTPTPTPTPGGTLATTGGPAGSWALGAAAALLLGAGFVFGRARRRAEMR